MASDFPHNPELDALVQAFEAGDFARVREGVPRILSSTSDEAVKRAASELLARTRPDPLATLLVVISAVPARAPERVVDHAQRAQREDATESRQPFYAASLLVRAAGFAIWPLVIARWSSVGASPGASFDGVTSLDGNICTNAGARRTRSTSVRSRTIDVYWSAPALGRVRVHDDVELLFRHVAASPAMLLSNGDQLSALVPFSLMPQMPSSVCHEERLVPATCGPACRRSMTPSPSARSPIGERDAAPCEPLSFRPRRTKRAGRGAGRPSRSTRPPARGASRSESARGRPSLGARAWGEGPACGSDRTRCSRRRAGPRPEARQLALERLAGSAPAKLVGRSPNCSTGVRRTGWRAPPRRRSG